MNDVYFHAGHQQEDLIQAYVDWILQFYNGPLIVYMDICIYKNTSERF